MKIKRPPLSEYQKQIIYSPARFTVTEAATKIGKTYSHLWWITEEAGLSTKVGANYWWIAPVYSQAKIAFTRLKKYLQGQCRVNESELYVALPNGTFIWFKSADKPDNLYGEDVYGAVFDEFTRAKEDAWIAIRSTLTATRGKCKFIGNVRGKKNWGYRLGVKARSGDPEYQYFKITATDAVRAKILSEEEILQAKKDLPEHAYKQLYLAEALEDGANPFGQNHIINQIAPLSDELPVCFGIDLAKSVDWTVVVGLDSNGQICFFDRWQSDWAQTRRRISEIVASTPGLIDSTGVGDPIAEDLIRECPSLERFVFTQRSKQQLMEGLASAVQTGTVTILDGVMRDEMESFEFEYTQTGVRYSAPDGMHDDTVCALALAVSSKKSNNFVGVRISSF